MWWQRVLRWLRRLAPAGAFPLPPSTLGADEEEIVAAVREQERAIHRVADAKERSMARQETRLQDIEARLTDLEKMSDTYLRGP